MLDIKRIREDYEGVKAGVERRTKGSFGIEKIPALDEKRRAVLAEVEAMKNKQNTVSKEIPKLKKAGEDTTAIMAEMKELSDKIKVLDAEVSQLDADIKNALLNIPNVPADFVQVGEDDSANVEIRKFKEPTKFDFEPKAHWDIGTDLDILDFERAAKISGTRFTVYKGLGARLERAIMCFMLDLHTIDQDYTEILPPFMVNRAAMTGTGQLPKFEEDMFYVPQKDFFLIPTAEVPVTNLLAQEIVPEEQLPIHYTSYTPCFQLPGLSGKTRQHPFQKRRRQGRIPAHAQRFRPGDRPYHRGSSRKLPAGRRQREDPGSAQEVHGRRRSDHQIKNIGGPAPDSAEEPGAGFFVPCRLSAQGALFACFFLRIPVYYR